MSETSLDGSISIENNMESFLKSDRAERIRENLVKIFELQYKKELDERKTNRKKLLQFSSKLNVFPKPKLFNSCEETEANVEASIINSDSNLPILSMQMKEKIVSLFRHSRNKHIR